MWLIIKFPISCEMIISKKEYVGKKKYYEKSLRNFKAYIRFLYTEHME